MNRNTVISKEYTPVLFTAPGAKLSGNYSTITRGGGFLFSSGFVHQEKLANYSHCLLYYEEKARAVFFEFTSDSALKEAVKLSYRPKTRNSSIQSRSFFRFFKLNLDEWRGRYPVEKINISRRGNYFAIFLDRKNVKSNEP